jgi:hypothetical protein
MRVRGSRYSGMPKRTIPPGSPAPSNTVTSYPSSARSCAALRPAGPDPMTATFREPRVDVRASAEFRRNLSGVWFAKRLPATA